MHVGCKLEMISCCPKLRRIYGNIFMFNYENILIAPCITNELNTATTATGRRRRRRGKRDMLTRLKRLPSTPENERQKRDETKQS